MNSHNTPGMTPPAPAREHRSGVKKRLTPKRRRPAVENHDYGIFARRVLRGYSRRVASGDIEAIADLTALSGYLDTAIQEAITGLRGIGYSWADIALRLGITRQAAQQRWGIYCDLPQDEHERGEQP